MSKTATKKQPENTLKRDVSSMRKVLATRLYELRTAAELSQAALAESAGIDRKTINRIENGHFSPSLDTLTRLSVVLKCRLSDLVEAKRTKR